MSISPHSGQQVEDIIVVNGTPEDVEGDVEEDEELVVEDHNS